MIGCRFGLRLKFQTSPSELFKKSLLKLKIPVVEVIKAAMAENSVVNVLNIIRPLKWCLDEAEYATYYVGVICWQTRVSS